MTHRWTCCDKTFYRASSTCLAGSGGGKSVLIGKLKKCIILAEKEIRSRHEWYDVSVLDHSVSRLSCCSTLVINAESCHYTTLTTTSILLCCMSRRNLIWAGTP